MIFYCATNLFIGGIKKNVISMVLVAGGIYLCFFLALSYCSQSYVFDSVDVALGGKADSFGIIQIDSLDENTPILIRYLTEAEGLMNATRSSGEPGITEIPGLMEVYQACHKGEAPYGEKEISVLTASPEFLRETGIRLENNLSWEKVISLYEQTKDANPSGKTVYCILGADYQSVPVGSEAVIQESEYGSEKRIRVIGHFQKQQKTVDLHTLNSEGLSVTTLLDSEIVVLREDNASFFFFDTEKETIVKEITSWAENHQISYSSLIIQKYKDFLETRYYETKVLNEFTWKSLRVLLPAFVLFLVILQVEMFYGERRELGLFLLNGVRTARIMTALLLKNLFLLLGAALFAWIAIVRTIPIRFSSNLGTIMQAALVGNVIPITILFALMVFLIQSAISLVSFRRNTIITLLRK